MNLPKISASKLLLGIPLLGTLIFYTWQPISDYFFTHSFDENIMLTMEYEDIKIDKENRLLIVHAKPVNRGNVPVELEKEDEKATLIIEVRKVENLESLKWIDKDKLELVNRVDALAKYDDGYMIEPNAYYDEVEAIIQKQDIK